MIEKIKKLIFKERSIDLVGIAVYLIGGILAGVAFMTPAWALGFVAIVAAVIVAGKKAWK